MKIKLILVASFALALAACKKDATQTSLKIQGTAKGALSKASSQPGNSQDNSSDNTQGSDQQDNQAPTSKLVDVTDEQGTVVGSLNITDARLALTNIEFEFEGDEEDFDEEDIENELEDLYEYEGPFIVDLIKDTVFPELGTALIEAGFYEEIEVNLELIEGDEEDLDGNLLFADQNDALIGNSIYVEGTYTGPSASGAQTDIPFVFAVDVDEDFDLCDDDEEETLFGLSIEAGEKADVIIAFRMQKWLAFDSEENDDLLLSPNQLVVENGKIDLTGDGPNAAIREMILDNIQYSADFGEDEDEDGILDSEEDDDPEDEDEDDD